MAIEIELKARIDDPEAVKERLSALGTCCHAYEKADLYWTGGTGFPELRVRRENRTGPDGTNSQSVLVTWKTRTMQDGIEINDERELSVSDADLFEELLAGLGLKRRIAKEKRGRAWTIAAPEKDTAPILAELSDVRGLGWFIELEILSRSGDERLLAAERQRLLSLLEKLEIPREKIESRPYTAMLEQYQI